MQAHDHTDPTIRRTTAPPAVDARLTHFERRLLEAFDELWDSFVDPADALCDADGTRWSRAGRRALGRRPAGVAFANEQQLAEIRDQCRALAAAQRVRHQRPREPHQLHRRQRATRIARRPRKGRDAARAAGRATCRRCSTSSSRVNHWHQRQQEIVRRHDRDGEVLSAVLRRRRRHDARAVRRAGPGGHAAATRPAIRPPASASRPTRDDVETVLGYYIDGRPVDAARDPASQGQRRRQREARPAAVLSRAQEPAPGRKAAAQHERRGRNPIGHRPDPQAPRGHRAAAWSSSSPARPTRSVTSPATGRTSHFHRYAPGTILDAMAGTEYDFPAAGIDAGRYVAVLQAELRAIASRLVMPEFMLTSDASNANYSSTMVAEGPAVQDVRAPAART